MFGKPTRQDLEKRIAELEQENASLQHHLETLELDFYRKVFQQFHFDIKGDFYNGRSEV